MNRHVLKFVICLTVLCAGAATASACPNCKVANQTDSNLPQAYMYSILFMIDMPATIFTGFGISFYRLATREQQQLADSTSSFDAVSSSSDSSEHSQI